MAAALAETSSRVAPDKLRDQVALEPDKMNSRAAAGLGMLVMEMMIVVAVLVALDIVVIARLSSLTNSMYYDCGLLASAIITSCLRMEKALVAYGVEMHFKNFSLIQKKFFFTRFMEMKAKKSQIFSLSFP
jgi:hypothetical protein